MIVAIVILSLLLAGAIAAAIAMGYKAGSIRGDLTVAQMSADISIKAALECEESAEEMIRRKDLVISGLKSKLRSIRNELQNDPDPTVRGSSALDSVLSLLQEMQASDDADPSSDHKAGSLPPGV